MWKKRIVGLIVRAALIMASAIILSLITLTIFYHLSNLLKILFNKTSYYHYFYNFREILLTMGSIKIIYWYMVGLMTIESLLSLIFKNPILIITDTQVFAGLENALIEEIAALARWEDKND